MQEHSAVQWRWFSHLWRQHRSSVCVHQRKRENWIGEIFVLNLVYVIITSSLQEPDEPEVEDDNSRMDVDEDSRASSTGSAKKRDKKEGRSSKKKKKIIYDSEDDDDE